MYTDQSGEQPHPVPHALTASELASVVQEFAHAAKNVVDGGCDGVELHGANGYLLEQFLNPSSNQRTDAYGGSAENRRRFVLDVAAAVVKAVGGERVGIRLSPYGVNGGMTSTYEGIDDAYIALAKKLGDVGVQYIHLVDHSAMGAPAVPASLKSAMRAAFPRTFILAGGFTAESAEQALADKSCDLVAFGRPVLANPDFIARIAAKLPLNGPDFGTFYTPGPRGYTDYPMAT
jgi:N-ethylmaleimide reductase